MKEVIKKIRKKKREPRDIYSDCGTVVCAGGCGHVTYGNLKRPIYCYECGVNN